MGKERKKGKKGKEGEGNRTKEREKKKWTGDEALQFTFLATPLPDSGLNS